MGRKAAILVDGYRESTINVSSPVGGCLVSLVVIDGRLRIEVYRADDCVDVITPEMRWVSGSHLPEPGSWNVHDQQLDGGARRER